MVNGRDRNGSGLDFTVRGEQLVERSERSAVEFAGHCVGAGYISIDHAEQSQRLALLLEFFINAGVVTAESADSHHDDVDDTDWVQGEFPGSRLPPQWI